MKMRKVDMIVDLQYGSTGKGLIAGYLAETRKYDVVINANMPNAGHTYINSTGREWIHKVIPNGIVSPNLKYVMIGPGSVFDIDRFEMELDKSADLLKGVTVCIHENAMVLKDYHAVREEGLIESIGSTGQGSMAALVEKMARHPKSTIIARDYLPKINMGHYLCDQQHWIEILRDAKSILAEGAQGFSLGINQRFYPYCTSRECTPSKFLSDMGIPHNMLNSVIGTCRTYPIRVGGNSGGCYPDQEEITWESLELAPEKTTVTKRDRRIFTFSEMQIDDAIMACAPDQIFLNFTNYPGWDVDKVRRAIRSAMFKVHGYKPTGDRIMYLGNGPTFSNIIGVIEK